MKKVELTPEKQLTQRHFEFTVEKLNLDEAKAMLIELHHLMLVKDQVTLEAMKKDVRSGFNG